jgi:hypothetical protein
MDEYYEFFTDIVLSPQTSVSHPHRQSKCWAVYEADIVAKLQRRGAGRRAWPFDFFSPVNDCSTEKKSVQSVVFHSTPLYGWSGSQTIVAGGAQKRLVLTKRFNVRWLRHFSLRGGNSSYSFICWKASNSW